METYLVGGAVRDKLLNRPVGEKDWVVVGGSAVELEAEGYKRVGKDFPVFLHPETGEEYALARTETKTGPGHRGFDVYTDRGVSLEEDLLRRDLTINAIAESSDGTLTDPYGGQADIEAKLLRHVSDAFREDPLRVLRVARFAARFHKLGFRVATDTLDLMQDMAASGELDTLVPERIWKETADALGTSRPDIYIETLRECGALTVVFPELNRLFGVPQPPKWHPEIDTGIHILLVMQIAAQLTDSIPVRFAAMVHDLGKGTTDKRWWPSHRGHEQRSADLIKELCDRLGVPNHCRELALNVGLYHSHSHRALQLRPDTVLKLIENTDAFRRPDRFEEFLLACEADARGRTGLEDQPYHQAEILRGAFVAALAVSSEQAQEQGLEGPEFGAALRASRLEAISSALAESRES
jgi:tRNA nucleotidyltransferase (CCA-adding enzyme)